MEKKEKVKINRLSTVAWGFRMAWDMDKFSMLLWFTLYGALAVLPAIALRFNRETLSVLSGFISGEAYVYADVVRPIISLGLLMVAIGLSSRLNDQFVRMMLYDGFFAGMFRYLMERIGYIEMKDLLKKEVNDIWRSAYLESNSVQAFIQGTCLILAKLIGLAALLITAYSMSKMIFAISSVYVVVIFIISFAFMGQTRYNQLDYLHDERMVRYYEQMSENQGMAKETRIFENTDEVIKQWRKPYESLTKRFTSRELSSGVRDLISGFGFYVTLIVTVGVSISRVAAGAMKPDVFLVIFTLSLNMYNMISGTAGHIVRLDFGLVSMDKQRRFFKLMKPENAGNAETPADENTVFDVEDLVFSYEGKPVIKGISFKINKGEVVALVGANGSGKTTLTKLLLNMYKPDSGSIKMYGRTFEDYKRDFFRKNIGVSFQDYYIYHAPIRENVGLGSVEDIDNEEKVLRAINRGGADKVVEKLPQGINTLLEKKYDRSGTILSGGEKQRVAVSRAHMSNSDVMIFDEPASMLDPIAEMEQYSNIQDLLNGRTAILISHRVGFARMADKIIMMNEGEIAEMGKHDELIAMDGLYARFFNEQAQWYDTAGMEKEGEI